MKDEMKDTILEMKLSLLSSLFRKFLVQLGNLREEKMLAVRLNLLNAT